MVKKILILIGILVVIIGLGAVVFISSYWNAPLGPGLELAIQVPERIANSSDATTNDTLGQEGIPQPTPTQQSLIDQIISLFKPRQSANNALCDGPGTMTILLIGSDERSNDYLYGLADSIRIVRVDFIKPGVMMLDVPRDLWVEIPGISDHYGITHAKLNQAYFFGNPGMGYYDGPGAGPGLLARTLDQNFGLQVDHYLAVDLTTFERFIDSVGGIDVTFEAALDLTRIRQPLILIWYSKQVKTT
jgi:LCP family protein required for cell wall assembly